MTFNPNSDISGANVHRSRGRRTAVAGGVGGLGLIAVLVIGQFLGIDLSPLVGAMNSQQSIPQEQAAETVSEECRTGQDANDKVQCRMAGASVSLDDFWQDNFSALTHIRYQAPRDFILFSGGVDTACGSATSATGPFYCPGDEMIYIDTTFFDQLRSDFGASGGPLAELYIVAHEWGHHIQNLEGTFARTDRNETGPSSGTVRIELQADCYAGAWVGAAANTTDSRGNTLLEPPTRAQVADALDAAATVGDDRIQQQATGRVNPEAWTHGSSEQRQRWFATGYQGGPTACNTMEVAASGL